MRNKGKVALILTGVLLALAVISIFIYQQTVIRSTQKAIEYNHYDKHFALVTSESDKELWDSVYESASEEGKAAGVYVERFGANFDVKYSKVELFRMAMQASVDGIIVEGDETDEMVELIDQALDSGIPVITVLNDSSRSKRQSYVGFNSFSVGQEYGKRIINEIGENPEKEVQVLAVVNSEKENSGQNRMLIGLRETLFEAYDAELVKVESVSIDNADNFAMEEYMRELCLEEQGQPDYLVCFDSASTTQAYTSCVKYNAVGKMHLFGYYDSKKILSAVSKELLDMTVSLDTEQMGKHCVDVLLDYEETGYANGYLTVNFDVIEKDDALRILSQEENENDS